MKHQLRLKLRRNREGTGPRTQVLLICFEARKAGLPGGCPAGVSSVLPTRAVVHMLASEQRVRLATWLTGAQLCASPTAQLSVSNLAVVRGCRRSQEERGGGPVFCGGGSVRWVHGGVCALCLGKLSITVGQEPGPLTWRWLSGAKLLSFLLNDLLVLSISLLEANFLGLK